MKKILFLSPLPPPHYGSAISSEMCLSILKKSDYFSVENIKLNYSKEISDVGRLSFDKILGIFKVKQQIQNKMLKFQPDLIYFVPATSGLGLIRDYFFVKQIKKFCVPILFHIRSRISETDRAKKLYHSLYKKMFSGEKVIVLGNELINDVSLFARKENIIVLPNAIPNEVSDSKLNSIIKSRIKRKSFNLLFLSNMDKTKGWFKFLEACKLLKDSGISFMASFVGAWPGEGDRKLFEDFVSKNNLSDVVFYLGKKTGKDKNKILENSDVLIFPTEYKLETFGRVIVEAMMFGLPVIASGVATIPSTIEDGKTGFILKNNSPEEIKGIISCLSKEQCEKLGLAGRKRFLDKFDSKKYKPKFMKIIKSCF